jgi:hypothetical protein
MATPAKVRADDQIQKEVPDELTFDARVQPNEIGVIVKAPRNADRTQGEK